jgi:hypothetical protein
MLKTGKLAPKAHLKTLDFAKYLTGEVPPSVATKVYREYLTPDSAKLMYGNDQYGDCVWAAAANTIILTSVHTGSIVIPTLDDVLGAYSAVTGFNPVTGANDNGTAITDALAYLQTTGMAGHKILGWAKIDHTNQLHRELGVDYFGATFVGVQLPNSAQTQFAGGGNWEVTSDLSIDGGHAILHPGYGYAGDDYVTWAKWDQKASAEWSSTFIDEEYVLISDSWFNAATKKTPMGLDIAALEADLKAISA